MQTGEVFARNQEKFPLEADVVIIDEMSMVDIYLMHSLLLALVPGNQAHHGGRPEPAALCGAWKCLEGHYRVQIAFRWYG